ncbi:XRE family transcriptional regulator [Planktothrix tepida]|uniref:XRE family transcriptional regulator n=2 Tax=Planktothrix TaxID=54304 RepID=A0A1J1LGY3_9CYAN|nr:XRE family transcriptional regulator [Planktothrix tepida]CAD5984110.1 XRE family transcriptional regulator [Planktothrix pseudagardhii]CUR30841.1 XRE family transcriptional regulator [Planktothrix tepida PCC 9214]
MFIFYQNNVGLIRVKVQELAAERGWTLKEVAERSGVFYNSVKHKLARTFDVMIENLVEIIEE